MFPKALRASLVLSCLGAGACSPHAVAPIAAASNPAPIAFHEGGVTAVLAEAQRAHKPVFVDLWAVWCPPCMAMRAWTFESPELRAMADRFVWLSVDRDGPEGGDAAKRWDANALPTVLVLDPDTGAPRARWDGALSGPELAGLLSVASESPMPAGAAEAFSPTRVLYRDDEEGRAARARAGEVLRSLPPSSPLAPFLVAAMVWSARDHHDLEDCMRLGDTWSDRLAATGLALEVAISARGCAMDAKQPTIAAHELARAGLIVENRESQLLPFRRGYAALQVKTFRSDAGDTPGADELTANWWSFLHDQWGRSTVAQRISLAAPTEMWFDRAKNFGAATTLMGDLARQSPTDVEALRRWGESFQIAGRFEEGVHAIERGLPAITPPNRLPAIWEEAELLEKMGDKATEATVLEAALRLPQPAWVSRRFETLRADAEKRLAELHAH